MIKPMLAKSAGQTIPSGTDWAYEPKWDGFRCLVFRTHDGVVLQSRNGEDLAYAFPEVVAAAESLPVDSVLDGELVIRAGRQLDFDLLSQRIRPRSEAGGWKIAELSRDHPAEYVAFDLLRLSGVDHMDLPFGDRRDALTSLELPAGFHLTPLSRDPDTAARWFTMFEGAGLDGLVCKDVTSTYQPGKRTMVKVKHVRTADVVVAGWREYKNPDADGSPLLGAMLLGLYDDAGRLQSVGAAASFTAARRREFADLLRDYETSEDGHPWRQPGDRQRLPGVVSRWSGGKSAAFRALRPELVAEVKYDHLQAGRFRHVTTFLRWRPDREPLSCTFEQLDVPSRFDVAHVLGGSV